MPEIADGLVEIQNVAREPGYRSKIAVVSHASGVDPVGACVGPRGSRVRMVVSELRGEKIDIIPFNEEPARFVAKALSPARVREVLVDDEAKQATVIVPDDQLSLAIGKDGLNARLAARLTGWRVDIRSETEFAEEEAEMGYDEEEVAGRCAAILANGKRCPNASLPGSRYCGLPAHQALEDQDTDYVVPPEEGDGDGEAPPRRSEPAAEEPAGDEPAARGAEAADEARPRTPRPSRRSRSRLEEPAEAGGRGGRGGRAAERSRAEPPRSGARKRSRRAAPPLRRLPPLAPQGASCCGWCAAPTGGPARTPTAVRRGAAPTSASARSAPSLARRSPRAVLSGAGDSATGDHRLNTRMAKKRVHEIAKEKGIPSKEVLAILQKAGFDVKAAASSVDEDDIARAFDDGAEPPRRRAAAPRPPTAQGAPAPASGSDGAPRAPAAPGPDGAGRRPADGAGAGGDAAAIAAPTRGGRGGEAGGGGGGAAGAW